MEKRQKTAYCKSVDEETKRVSGYVSTFEFDRDGDRFVKGAWNLKNYLLNPVVLWSHDLSQPPIGKNVDIKEDDHGLIATTEFDKDSPEAMRIFSLFQRGFLNAFSVGFMVQDWKMEVIQGSDRKGVAITGAELYEYSAVSVPANPGAIISRELAGMVRETLGEKAIELIMTKSMGEQFLVVPPAGQEQPARDAAADLETSLKGVMELARVAKNSKLTESKRSLMVSAVQLFNEIISANPEEPTAEEMKKMQEAVMLFGAAVKKAHPSEAGMVDKAISQIDRAVTA